MVHMELVLFGSYPGNVEVSDRVSGRVRFRMRPGKMPPLSRGRDRHRIAVLVVADTVALEVAIAQQVFGPRMYSFAKITGDADSPYEVILCGEQERYALPSGIDLGALA